MLCPVWGFWTNFLLWARFKGKVSKADNLCAAATRNIAHQNVPIDKVMEQARHLNITLLGIPLRRASGEPYRDRIERGCK